MNAHSKSTNLLAKKAMLASLNIKQWSGRRLDREATDEVNEAHGAADDAGRYNKLLVAKEALDPIQKIVTRARIDHATMTQPWSNEGVRILPATLYLKYSETMEKHRVEFERAADEFCRAYDQHVANRRKALGTLFKAEDYPTDIRSRYSFGWSILPCPDASDFRVDLAAEHAADIRAEIERDMQKALEHAMQEPARRIVATVGRMAERLKAYKPASKKGERSTGIFKDSLVENVRELVELLPAFNLTNDKLLNELTTRIRSELCIEDAATLRENEHARAAVAASADDILAKVNLFLA